MHGLRQCVSGCISDTMHGFRKCVCLIQLTKCDSVFVGVFVWYNSPIAIVCLWMCYLLIQCTDFHGNWHHNKLCNFAQLVMLLTRIRETHLEPRPRTWQFLLKTSLFFSQRPQANCWPLLRIRPQPHSFRTFLIQGPSYYTLVQYSLGYWQHR